MTYLLLVYLDEKAWAGLSPAEQQRMMTECAPLTEALAKSGKFLGSARLEPEAATTVRLRDGKPLVTDGPFAETREQVGGYILIEAADRPEAEQIAGEFLGKRSLVTIEVRAIAEMKGVEKIAAAVDSGAARST